MAPTGRHRRREVAVAALLALAAAGCTGGDGSEPPAPSTPPVTSGSPGTDPAGLQDSFPGTAQEYAERTVGAWAAPDLIRLAELATPEVHRQIVELPGPPDLSWSFIRCQDGPGIAATECAFYNQDGDRLVLTVDRRRLSQRQATTAMSFEVTLYPDDPAGYLEAFLAAWQDGNLGRMNNLAAPPAVQVYQQLPPTAEVDYRVGEPAGPLVEVMVTIPDGTVATGVSTALLGQPQAIRTASHIPE